MQAVQVGVVIDALIITTAVGTVGVSMIFIVKTTAKWIWRNLLDDLGHAIDSRIEKFEPLADDIAYIKAQLEFNGGSTVKDQVLRIVKWIDKQETDQ